MKDLFIARKQNSYIIHKDEGYAEILLENKNKKVIASALVDLEDLPRLIIHRWTYHRGYAFSFRHRMHRMVLRLGRPDIDDFTTCVDHINGNTLDNRKSNLRICTKIENAQHAIKPRSDNSTGAVGVALKKAGKKNKYRAYITVNKKTISLGVYDTFENAVRARLEAEIAYFGKYMGCNAKFIYLLNKD